MAARRQMSKIDQIWPHKSHFSSAFGCHSSDLDKIWHEHTSWPYKQVCARMYQSAQNSRWPPEVKGPKSTKFDPINYISARHLNPVHPIWNKFGMGILLDLTSKPVQEFLIYSKIKDGGSGCHYGKFTKSAITCKLYKFQNKLFTHSCFQGYEMQWIYHFRSTITATISRSRWPPFRSK